jgi:hypothetical protein
LPAARTAFFVGSQSKHKKILCSLPPDPDSWFVGVSFCAKSFRFHRVAGQARERFRYHSFFALAPETQA